MVDGGQTCDQFGLRLMDHTTRLANSENDRAAVYSSYVRYTKNLNTVRGENHGDQGCFDDKSIDVHLIEHHSELPPANLPKGP